MSSAWACAPVAYRHDDLDHTTHHHRIAAVLDLSGRNANLHRIPPRSTRLLRLQPGCILSRGRQESPTQLRRWERNKPRSRSFFRGVGLRALSMRPRQRRRAKAGTETSRAGLAIQGLGDSAKVRRGATRLKGPARCFDEETNRCDLICGWIEVPTAAHWSAGEQFEGRMSRREPLPSG
jgi:hypothetical protein